MKEKHFELDTYSVENGLSFRLSKVRMHEDIEKHRTYLLACDLSNELQAQLSQESSRVLSITLCVPVCVCVYVCRERVCVCNIIIVLSRGSFLSRSSS